MFDILIGTVVGMAVCVFGMWAFIRGQRNGIEMKTNKIPEQIKTPSEAVSNLAQSVKDNISEHKEQKKIEGYVNRYVREVQDFEG